MVYAVIGFENGKNQYSTGFVDCLNSQNALHNIQRIEIGCPDDVDVWLCKRNSRINNIIKSMIKPGRQYSLVIGEVTDGRVLLEIEDSSNTASDYHDLCFLKFSTHNPIH